MLIGIGIIGILLTISMIITFATMEDVWAYIALGLFVILVMLFILGCFTGFVNYPVTEGTHQGVVTAVDLEGVYFRRYQIYLKSSGYTGQSDESIYLLYDYEKELADKIKDAIGKEIKLTYGHDGGYISWKSCGIYHIKSFEIVEEK